MKRSDARELAFIIVFEHIFSSESLDTIIEDSEEAAKLKKDAFGYKLAKTAIEKIESTDKVIERLSHKWKISRLPKTTLAILRLAIAEITYVEEVPSGVSANEAVELAKKYSTEEDASYINGILGVYIKELEEIKA